MSITTSGASRLIGLAVLLLVVGGCGSGGDGHQPATPSAGVSPSSSTSPSATGSAGSLPGGIPGCVTPDLRASVSRGEGAAGSTYFTLRLSNVSRHRCHTGGYGGVSLVGTPGGAPIGAPADRVDTGQAKPLTLQPGGHAQAVLRVVNAGNFSAAACRPTAARGLKVYPPNEKRSLFVPLTATACRSPKTHLLSLAPYVLGG